MAQRLTFRQITYARARGRNGWFVPKLMEYEFSQHPDGTPLVTIRVYSRRASGAAPLELTVAVSEWEAQALAIQLAANEERRQRRQRPDPGTRA